MLESNKGLGCLKDSGRGYGLQKAVAGRANAPGRLTVFGAAFCILLLCQLFGPLLTAAFSLPSEGKQQVRCLIFVEGNKDQEDRVQALFQETNEYLEREGADIALVPSATAGQIEFTGDSARAMLAELRRAAAAVSDPWDLAIAFTTAPLRGPNGENWTGAIEKRESRHIIIKCLNRNTLLHEIGHALGLQHGTGMMLPTLKTNYVRLDSEYMEALKKMTFAWSAGSGAGRYVTTARSAQGERAPRGLRYAQAGVRNR